MCALWFTYSVLKVEVAICGDLDVDPNRALPLTVRFNFPISACSSDIFATIVKCKTFTCLGTTITINIYGIVINRSINLGWELIIAGELGIGARPPKSRIFSHMIKTCQTTLHAGKTSWTSYTTSQLFPHSIRCCCALNIFDLDNESFRINCML